MAALAGFAFNVANTVYGLTDKLDRNCEILVQLDQDIRLHIIADRKKGDPKAGLGVFPEVKC